MANITRIHCDTAAGEATAQLKRLFTGEVAPFCDWIAARRGNIGHPFEQASLAEDLESLKEVLATKNAKAVSLLPPT